MAVAPLAIPQWQGSAPLDFSSLAQLPQIYKQAQAEAIRRDTLATLGQGGQIDPMRLVQSGDMNLANLGIGMMNRQREEARQSERDKVLDARADRQFAQTQQYQNAQLALSRRAAERADERATVPDGFERNPAGGIRPIPGGPQDPDYIERAAKGKTKPRQMSVGDISKLSEEGGKFQSVTRFADTFEDDFGGRPLGMGTARNWVASNLPSEVTDPSAQRGATWWQDYNKYRSVVRNELYGSALTAPERRDFERADINPGMTPKQIKANLKIQKGLTQKAVERKATALVNEGYSGETVRRAFGLDQDAGGQSGGGWQDVDGVRIRVKP